MLIPYVLPVEKTRGVNLCKNLTEKITLSATKSVNEIPIQCVHTSHNKDITVLSALIRNSCVRVSQLIFARINKK